MTAAEATYATHDVYNQSGDLGDVDLFGGDAVLREAVAAYDAGWAVDRLHAAGRVTGSAETRLLARQANRILPELRTHDRFGNRVDQIEFHPAWHELMARCFGSGAHSLPWVDRRPGSQVARAVLSYLWNQAENGICCPMGMTFSSVAALRHAPDLAAHWEPMILRDDYDPRPLPAERKRAVTVGMAMTEKQGGSDLRRTQTTARPAGNDRGPGSTWLLTGHKWFFSVPQSDVFLTLAQTEKGVTCFLVRGWLPDGTRNRLKIQRLKDKCGNRSNASSEVEFYDMEAQLVGEEGHGIRASIEMAHLTRLDFAVGSAGLMRQAVTQAIHHTSNRSAFQKRLLDLPIMGRVVADLALEVEGMTWMGLRLAATLDREATDEGERLLGRIATPMAKYWACKRAPAVVTEALGCHGGNGFIEDHLMARLFREAPLNGIWEGTGSVICLDVVRAIRREPATVDAFLDVLRTDRGAETLLDREADALADLLPRLAADETPARHVVERMAHAFQAALMIAHAPGEVAAAFCATRLGEGWRGHFGGGAAVLPVHAIVDRARLAK